MPTVPQVTVLMTVYNGMPYLKAAVESILSQTLSDFELLVIDDASTDGSADVVGSFADPRIRLIRNPRNLGQAGSLNKGIFLARAAVIARMDQDDLALPCRLEIQLRFLEEHPECAAVGSWLYWINSEGKKTGLTGLPIRNFGSFLGILLGQATPVGHPTAMFRRQALEEQGGYDEAFAPCEDYELWCRLALRRRALGVVPRPLLMLRLHQRQQSAMKLESQKERAGKAHDRLVEEICAGDGSSPEGIASLLRMEESFYAKYPASPQVAAVLKNLEKGLERARERFDMTPEEHRQLRHRVAGWLGRAAFLGVLRRNRESRQVYRLALRLNPWAFRSVPLFFYPIYFWVSPVLSLAAGKRFTRWASWLNRKRYVARLLLEGLRAP